MDQAGTTQLSSGECSRTTESSQPNKSTCSEHGQKFDVFLSHSGKQKDFVRQLYRDLTNQGVSCFFDQDPESLPLAEHFPSHIFEAAKTCKVAVLLLSKDFLQSKWPMQELAAFVEAKDISNTNPNLKLLPLFYKISPDALKNTKENEEKWKQLAISRETPAEWHRALKAIRPISGLPFAEGGDEVKFRDEIVKGIWHILPAPSPRYHVRGMQGEARMCQEVTNFFNKVQPNIDGIRIAGLCGIAGHGKTTVGKAFCNFKLGDFYGRVCHLEFSRGDPFERTKLALQYLTHRPASYLQTLTNHDQAKVELDGRVKRQRVLLVVDNITEESIEEVAYYLKADLGENSWILLSARSVDVLEKHFPIDKQSCMHVPRLKENEAIAILLERAFTGESTLGVEDRRFALKCADRCSFEGTNCDNGSRARTFHPLALKAFGGYLSSKYRLNLSKWVEEVEGMVDRPGDGLDDVFTLLDKAFDNMLPKYRTIFMLLTVYMLPNMSPYKATEWMAINCNEKIEIVEKAVEDLVKMAFIEEFKSEIRIHDLYVEFAQWKANEMDRWLWWKDNDPRGLIAKDKAGFELAKLEQCRYRIINPNYLGNLFALQLVGVDNMIKLDLGPIEKLRSITLWDCKELAVIDGMEKLVDLAWLQIRGGDPMFKLPELSSLVGLQHLEIDIAVSHGLNQLGDLTSCFYLRDIHVCCPSLSEFPRLKGMKHLEKVEFSLCDKVKGPLDCRDCVKLQTVVFNLCCQMAASPLLTGCKNLSKLVLSECDAVTACPDVDEPSTLKELELNISSEASSAPKSLESCHELEYLKLWNMEELMRLPSFKRLSNLTVLKLVKCGLREPPDLTCCDRLEDVYFCHLNKLVRFPSFSSLRVLKKLSLCNCTSVEDPPDIEGCHKLQVFHLLYNDYMKGLPNMDKCEQLEEIQVSWHSAGEVQYQGFNPYSCQVDDNLEFCLEHFKDEKFGKIGDVSVPEALENLQWVKSKRMLVKRYFRGLRLYYSLTAPYEDGPSKDCRKKTIILGMMNGKVTSSPTMAKDCQDRYWLKKVEGYFSAQKDIAPAIVTSASSDIVEDISLVIPLSPRYRVPPMQGEERMCEVVADFFKTVNPNEKGIRIAGLYGMPGQGKTTLSKAFCDRSLRNYDGKVCYLEFGGGSTLERIKLALQHLTQSVMPNQDDAYHVFTTLVKGQRVLLVLDNVTDQNIEEVKYYLGTDFGKDSCILLSTRRQHVLEKYLKIDWKSCMHVPSLQETEAIDILWERKPSGASGFSLELENKDFALKYAKKCSFEDEKGFVQFHPLALKAFGRHLFRRESNLLSNWAADGAGDGSKDVFVVLDKVFDGMEYKWRIIFMLLARHMPPNIPTEEAFEWLARNCNGEIEYIKKAVVDLCESGFIEEIEPQIRIHELLKEFAHNKDKYARVGVKRMCQGIACLLPVPLERYPIPIMQGGARMCKKLADFFNTVRPNEKGIRIAGLCGMPGQGKTTLGKTFCNLNLWHFNGKVCHLEFCGGNKLDRQKLALQYLTDCTKSELESLISKRKAHHKFCERVWSQKVLLVLDNITEKSVEEVKEYLKTGFVRNSCVLLSARSKYLLEEKFNINSESCMSFPCLEEEEAIAILLERTSLAESAVEAENRGFALQCANRCCLNKTTRDIVGAVHTFHPLALKALGQYLFSKYGADLSQWVAEADGLVFGPGDSLDDVFIVLDKALDIMDPKHRTIFMLLTLYLQPIMSPLKVSEWLAITCKEEIECIEKAVEELQQYGFIEEIDPEIRIHHLYAEFAQTKARKMQRWLWCKHDLVTSEAEAGLFSKVRKMARWLCRMRDQFTSEAGAKFSKAGKMTNLVTSDTGAGLFSKDEAGFELANVEYCQHLDLCTIGDNFVKNLWALQIVDGKKKMSNLRFKWMKHVSSFNLHNCEYLEILGGMENLPYMGWIQVGKVPDFKILNLSSLNALQYLDIDIRDSSEPTELGDLTFCVFLREIYVCCPSLSMFPRINGLQYLEKASFECCFEVTGPLNCSNCVELRSIVFEDCSQMACIPLILGCSNLSKIVFSNCYIPEYLHGYESSALDIPVLCILSEDASAPRHLECCDGFKSHHLWNIVIWRGVLSLRRLSRLTVLKLYNCDIWEASDVRSCRMLEEVYFFTLKKLEMFPDFSSLRKLKKLCLCNCMSVRAPPDCRGCQELEVFHLLYNDHMDKLPQMDGYPLLHEIKLSWKSSEAVNSRWNEDDDLEICPDYQKYGIFRYLNDVSMPVELKRCSWIRNRAVQVKKYSRGWRKYYYMTAPYV